MLAAAAFCPAPPLLHPQVAAGAAPETDDLRAACATAVTALIDDVDVVVTVAIAPRTGWYGDGARGSLRGLGVDVALGRGDGPVELPTGLGLAAWLLDTAGFGGAVHPFGVTTDEDPARCRTLGAGLADRAPRVGMLVMGDGSACRDAKAPGSFNDRAEQFDLDVVSALTDLDDHRLANLDPAICTELLVSGRAPWQLAAGAASGRTDAGLSSLRGTRIYEAAPYGVGYAVIGWHEHD